MSTHYIRVFFGPVESFGMSSEHRPQFVYGLRDHLRKLGNRVDLVPIPYLNLCLVECCGYIMFRCNIRSLCFNTPYIKDPVCQNAIDAVLDGTEKLQRARTYIWLWHLIDNQIFKRTEFATKDYWISDMPPLKEDTELELCAECCRLTADFKRETHESKFARTIVETYASSNTSSYEYKEILKVLIEHEKQTE